MATSDFRPLLAVLLGAAALAGCTSPPPEAFTTISASRAAESRPAGPDARGDACLAQAGRAPTLDRAVAWSQDIYCGGWTQPAARVVALRAGSAADLDAIAGGGAWRSSLAERLSCSEPETTRLSDGTVARLLRCTRRQGGWPHIAVVTTGVDGVVMADGMPSSLPVIERIARGQTGSAAGAAAARSDAMQIEAVQLASRAFGSNDIRDYERAMQLGAELNLSEDYAAAENAYRAALAVQERVLGADSPETVAAVVHLALNLSNQGRYREAEALFRRADRISASAADPLAPVRLLHYRALHAMNQSEDAQASALMMRAEVGYQSFVPASLLGRSGLEAAGSGSLASPIAQTAVMGLAEVQRTRGTLAARSGDQAGALALSTQARQLLRSVSFERAVVSGMALRTEAAAAVAAQNPGRAGDLLEKAAERMSQPAPGQMRSEARTLFLAGLRRQEAGQTAAALASFRAGAAILRDRRLTLDPELLLAYLDTLAATAAANPVAAANLQREMFGAAQLAQRGQTVRLAAQSAARLAASSADQRTGGALRRLQDLDQSLRELFAERDALGASAPPAQRRDLDTRLAEKLSERNDAEAEAAAAAPGYRQLLLSGVGADEVARSLGTNEVLAQLMLGSRHGYAFVVRRDGAVTARRIDLGETTAAALVNRLRRGVDQGAPVEPFDTAVAAELYDRLFGPVSAALEGADRMVVIPDGPLLAIPFGMLLTGPADPAALASAPWLIRRVALVHATSAQALVTLRAGSSASAAPRSYIGFGDFVPPSANQLARVFPADRCAEDSRLAAGLVRLPGTREEVRIAARLAGAGERDTVFGEAFTADALRRADLAGSRIVHLATHALLPGELSCVTEPSIVLSPARGALDAGSAFLRSSEVLTMRLDADLVILSACNTAGPASGLTGTTGTAGEALSGLARSFFFAGARGLLVSHWPAVDQAAAITVADTMRRQEAGGDSASALRGAQLTLLDEAGRGLPAFYAHPYFWAAFALIGDGRRAGPARTASAAASHSTL